ncbi:GAF domain-containing protein, partial [Streptomyces sp. NPDC059627]
MTGSGEPMGRARERLTALLVEASTGALGAAGGHVAGVYLRSGTPGLLRLATLVGLPGPLFRPWWRLHVDRPFPVADAYRLGVRVVLPDATEMVRRYPQFAAGLPFQFGSVYTPVPGAEPSFGVLTVLRPATPDTVDELPDLDRLGRLAESLGAGLRELVAEEGDAAVAWEGEPVCIRPPASRPGAARVGRFTWDPATSAVRADDRLHALLGMAPQDFPGTAAELAVAVTPDDADDVLAALRETAAGKPPYAPLRVRAADGTPLLLELWPPPGAADPSLVSGIVVDPGRAAGAADGAADLLPQGVFCLDRSGVVRYANPAAVRLAGRPRSELLGRPVWEAMPWLSGPPYDDHWRGALLARGPVHFQVRRGDAAESDLLALSVHPGQDLITCTVAPAGLIDPTVHLPRPAEPDAAGVAAGLGRPGGPSMAPLYRPIALAIALTDAVTARQVSAVVTQELLPAFGGGRLAIYLLQDRHLYLAWENGFPAGFLAPFDGVGLDARIPGVEALTTGRPLFFESMRRLADTYPGLPLDATVGARAFLPLIASGRPVGTCILGFDVERGFSTEERTVLTALAGLIAHAMEKARRYDSEAALARGVPDARLARRESGPP